METSLPYKGLEYLIAAFDKLLKRDRSYRLLIVGKPKGPESYWHQVRRAIASSGIADRVIAKIEYVPDEETELYFKAADVLILPYTHVFQSGVLFLGYSFGLPAIAADVGSLKEEIIEGQTGFVSSHGIHLIWPVRLKSTSRATYSVILKSGGWRLRPMLMSDIPGTKSPR